MASKRVEFQVQGTGDFPFDMLRYNQCWPKREDEITKLNLHWAASEERRQQFYRDPRTITLVGNNDPSGRWESFGWKVVPNSIRKY